MDTSKSKEDMISDIVSMLDNFMAEGGGHMNIDVNTLTANKKAQKQVEKTISSDCNSKNMACRVTTLESGIDGDEN